MSTLLKLLYVNFVQVSNFSDEEDDDLIQLAMSTTPRSTQSLNMEGTESVESMSKK